MLARLAVVVIALLIAGCSIGAPEPARDVTNTSATLDGLVLSLEPDSDVQWWFRYGTTTAYGSQTPERTLHFPAEQTTFVRVSEPISGLVPWTTYHYQLCTAPPRGGCFSGDRELTTGPNIVFLAERGGRLGVWRMDAGGHNQIELTPPPPPFGASTPTASPDGSQIAFSRFLTNNNAIWVMDADGSDLHAITDGSSLADNPAWSPDGSKIAFAYYRDDNPDIYVMDTDGGNQTRLTDSPTSDYQLTWSPDMSKIAFTSNRGGTYQIYVMDADGSDETLLSDGAGEAHWPSWSPDGDTIAFFRADETVSDSDIWLMDADGGNPRNLTETPDQSEGFPAYSPDGSRIAFSRSPGGNDDIWVMKADGSDQQRLTDAETYDAQPTWLPVAD